MCKDESNHGNMPAFTDPEQTMFDSITRTAKQAQEKELPEDLIGPVPKAQTGADAPANTFESAAQFFMQKLLASNPDGLDKAISSLQDQGIAGHMKSLRDRCRETLQSAA